MGNYEDKNIGGGRTERVHYGSDGRPNGRREFFNASNYKSNAEMAAFNETVYGDEHRTKCYKCGGNSKSPHTARTRARNTTLGFGIRKAKLECYKCDDCGAISEY